MNAQDLFNAVLEQRNQALDEVVRLKARIAELEREKHDNLPDGSEPE